MRRVLVIAALAIACMVIASVCPIDGRSPLIRSIESEIKQTIVAYGTALRLGGRGLHSSIRCWLIRIL